MGTIQREIVHGVVGKIGEMKGRDWLGSSLHSYSLWRSWDQKLGSFQPSSPRQMALEICNGKGGFMAQDCGS